MNKNILIVHVEKGRKYSNFIAKETNLLGIQTQLATVFTAEKEIKKLKMDPNNTIVHFRTAGPKRATPLAKKLENQGYKVINGSQVLERTSDKFLSFEWAANQGIKLPRTIKLKKNEAVDSIKDLDINHFVIKPVNSISQGAYCYQSSSDAKDIQATVHNVPGENVVVQEFINYQSLYRVVVINGNAIRKAVFYDKPTKRDWKVSVCLNPKIKHDPNPRTELIEYAQNIAKIFELQIGFIDIFHTKNDTYVLSEINTACNLTRHERLSRYNISRDIARHLVSKF
jgi:glutathione synthase/RimK-type ligase-like ATP-grasp enzyme